MTEGLGVAASAIAVIELTAKVASLCLDYSNSVKGARDDIDRLRAETLKLQHASQSVKELLDGPHGARLQATQQLKTTLAESQLRLEQLEKELTPNPLSKRMKRFGFRALKWPFKSQDVEKAIQNLMGFEQTISLSLQVDQTVQM